MENLITKKEFKNIDEAREVENLKLIEFCMKEIEELKKENKELKKENEELKGDLRFEIRQNRK